jgi:hypothetical protein
MYIEKVARYEHFILIGLIMTIGAFVKLSGFYDFSSDWFWFLAGIGLSVEGSISLVKQRKFDKKYKIIERKL